MSAEILQGNVFDALPTIKPGSVDLCVTSPPYWRLRSYLPKGHPLKPLELGSEESPAAYISNLVKVFDLVRTAMADHGTCWINCGDTYSAGQRVGNGTRINQKQQTNAGTLGFDERPNPDGISSGNLCLIPQRLAIALQDDGWLVRSVIAWVKPAPMPQSLSGWSWRRCRVKMKSAPKTFGCKVGSAERGGNHPSIGSFNDYVGAQWSDCHGCKKCEPNGGYVLRRGSWRPTSSWEPILMLAKGPNYFCDGEAVKTPAAPATVERDKYSHILYDPDEQFAVAHDHETICNGANLRDVWTIAAESLKEKHYAAFPSELVYWCLAAGTSSKGYCPHCGRPWVRVMESSLALAPDGKTCLKCGKNHGRPKTDPQYGGVGQSVDQFCCVNTSTIGWRQSCRCPEADPRPGLVLDCFSGSGRTAIQAQRLGLNFVGIELNPEYVEMSRKLIQEANPLFAFAED